MKFTLKNGKTVNCSSGTYTVESWNAGRWQIENTFPGTKEGFEDAQKLFDSIENPSVRIQQWF